MFYTKNFPKIENFSKYVLNELRTKKEGCKEGILTVVHIEYSTLLTIAISPKISSQNMFLKYKYIKSVGDGIV